MASESVGMTPGRKIKCLVWMAMLTGFWGTFMPFAGAPDEITKLVLWGQIAGGLGVILGQSGIDAFTKWTEMKKP